MHSGVMRKAFLFDAHILFIISRYNFLKSSFCCCKTCFIFSYRLNTGLRSHEKRNVKNHLNIWIWREHHGSLPSCDFAWRKYRNSVYYFQRLIIDVSFWSLLMLSAALWNFRLIALLTCLIFHTFVYFQIDVYFDIAGHFHVFRQTSQTFQHFVRRLTVNITHILPEVLVQKYARALSPLHVTLTR